MAVFEPDGNQWKRYKPTHIQLEFGPEEIRRMSKDAWRLHQEKLVFVDKYKPIYRNLNGKDCIDFTNMVGDLKFKFEFYGSRPKRQNGIPVWGEVIPYNSCYLPDDGNKKVPCKELNPVEMWLEDRWVFARRIYGSAFVQKLFIQCLNFVYAVNNVQGAYFHAIQNSIVRELFDLDPKDFFMGINKPTWVRFWDQRCQGYISQNTAHYLTKRINVMGPTAAIFGKDFELFMLEEETFTTCPVDVLANSVYTCQGTLNKQSFDDDYQGDWSRTNNWAQSYGSSSWSSGWSGY